MGDVFLNRQEYFKLNQKSIVDILKNGYKGNMWQQDSKQWVKASKKYFFQEQKALLSELVVDIVKELERSKRVKRILDLGCNSGVLSLNKIVVQKLYYLTLKML